MSNTLPSRRYLLVIGDPPIEVKLRRPTVALLEDWFAEYGDLIEQFTSPPEEEPAAVAMGRMFRFYDAFAALASRSAPFAEQFPTGRALREVADTDDTQPLLAALLWLCGLAVTTEEEEPAAQEDAAPMTFHGGDNGKADGGARGGSAPGDQPDAADRVPDVTGLRPD